MNVTSQFEKMGARCKVEDRTGGSPISLDVRRDRRGEYFDIRKWADIELEVLQVDAKGRHLVLLTREGRVKSRFLCGHDEREWFVAAIPEGTPVTTVKAAKDALKPERVAKDASLPRRERGKRRTSAYKRQGEWFFIPAPHFNPGDLHVHHNEIITRSGRGGKPHVCAELVRTGGEAVYMRRLTVISEEQYLDLTPDQRKGWSPQMRNATVYVRGPIRHPDHATLDLKGWHEVVMNTEQNARAMSHVAFID